ncbi:unnamed protein product, partial [Rotaria sp. Silwood2]
MVIFSSKTKARNASQWADAYPNGPFQQKLAGYLDPGR